MAKIQRVPNLLYASLQASVPTRCRVNYSQYQFADGENESSTKFESDFTLNHIKTSLFQKMFLGVGSAAMSILNPRRADMIATMGETTGQSALKYMHNQMVAHPEGLEILRKRPRINSSTVQLAKLAQLPDGSLGKAYSNFLEVNKVTPDSRGSVQFVDDIELAYVIQRYREVHDLFHTLLDMPTNMLGEVTVKWVEAIQTRLPMCIGGALFGPLRLGPKQRRHYVKYHLPWAINTGDSSGFLLNVFYEQRWEQPLEELRQELNIKPLVIPNK